MEGYNHGWIKDVNEFIIGEKCVATDSERVSICGSDMHDHNCLSSTARNTDLSIELK